MIELRDTQKCVFVAGCTHAVYKQYLPITAYSNVIINSSWQRAENQKS